MINETSFRYFKRYNQLGIRTEMWCNPDTGLFQVFFEKNHFGLFFPYAVLKIKKIKDGKGC